MDTTSASTSISVDWEKVLPQIPGYDPFATADDCVFDPEAADHVVGFFRDCLTHVKGEQAGQPFVLTPWQQAVVGNLFGWKRPDGTRRYREALIFVPRKNGKTI
ncbi:MAG: terminase large subunit domain-containing protein, partial [Planctomycetota bacterium]